MRYPSKEDYLKAVQRSDSFTSKELRRAEFVPHPVWQIPAPAAGSSAVVFKAVVDGEEQALRFLTREDASRRDRYEALQEHFTGHGLTGCVAMSRWVDDAIQVNGRTWPVVRMQWVNGRTLNQYVDHLVAQLDTRTLGELAGVWRELLERLQSAGFAHGDLQHGNVLIDDRGALRLVDFDCSWIPQFAEQSPPTETGHHNYQPATRPWGRWMDTFSGLVVYLSLLTLSKNPMPWHALNTGENLLFQRDDFRPPFETPAWVHVSSIRDAELDELAGRLKECCAPGWSATGGLGELLAPRAVPWWERTGMAPTDPTRVGPVAEPPPPEPQMSPVLPPPPPIDTSPSPVAQHDPERPQPERPVRPWWGSSAGQTAPTQRPRPAQSATARAIGGVLAIGLVVALIAAGIARTVILIIGLLITCLFLLVRRLRR